MSNILDVPMWAISGDGNLSDLAKVIAEIRNEIISIEDGLIKQEENIEIINNRINMYIRTILNIKDYDNSKDLVIVNQTNEAKIYAYSDLSEDVDFSNLPNTDRKFQLTRQQAEKITNYLDAYAQLAIEYDDLLDDYDDLIDTHEELWNQIHDSLAETKFLHVHDTENDKVTGDEFFNKKKHILLVVKEESGGWGFKYIRKKDKKKFYEYIENQQKKSEEI